MALYRPDYKLIDAKKFVKNLDKDDTNNQKILHYIDYLEKRVEKKELEISEYQDVFNRMSKFLKSSTPKILR